MVNQRKTVSSTTDLQTRFGHLVRAYRRQLGITQEELAWRANLHRTYIADIERGARNVTLRSVQNLAKALEVTVGHLVSSTTVGDGLDSAAAVSVGPEQSGGIGEILLVEDSPNDAAMTARAFVKAKIANPLRIVGDAESGLDYLFSTGAFASRHPVQPRLILLDLNLPQMSGLDFLRRIKGDERTRATPVVILTVSRSDQMIVECSRLGAENYIVKPVVIGNLIQVTPKLNLHLTVGPPTGAKDQPVVPL